MLIVWNDEARAGLGEGFRDIPDENSLPCCKCGVLISLMLCRQPRLMWHAADLEFFRLYIYSLSL
jgi:hypothetical protein